MKDSFSVRDLPASDRPRERLARLGSEALSAQELLALILGSGTRKEPVMVLAQRLLSRFADLKGVGAASLEQLQKEGGLGLAGAARIKAAFEAGRRSEGPSPQDAGPAVRAPEDVVAQVGPGLRGRKKEVFTLLALDVRNHVIGGPREVSVGTLDMSVVHPREVFKEAISASAASVILVHNHPSGDPEPSDEDIKLTKRLVEVGELVGIAVTDHIIVADRRFVSLKGRNLF